MPVGEKQTYRFGHFELDAQCGQLRRDGVGLKLQGSLSRFLQSCWNIRDNLLHGRSCGSGSGTGGTFMLLVGSPTASFPSTIDSLASSSRI